MKPVQITKRQLQLIQLKTMGLLEQPDTPATKEELLAYIRQIGYLQIDTMQAVARAPYHVLWSHVGHYDAKWLDELLAEKQLFEWWAHALCFVPIEAFPIMRGLNLAGKRPTWSWEPEMMKFFPNIAEEVVKKITKHGPLCSADFPTRDLPTEYRNSWGGNKPEKIAMSRLFNQMELMIAYRKKFRRYYDLRERILPEWQDTDAASVEEADFGLVERSVKALGVATFRDVKSFMNLSSRYNESSFAEDIGKGIWIPMQVEDWAEPMYLHPENISILEQAQKNELEPALTTIMNPFDPLLTDRDRLERNWDFFFRLECYVPKAKREYGYFILPILHRGQFVGRMDTKAWRKEKEYEIIALYLEPGVEWGDDVIEAVRQSVWDFAHWQHLKTVRVTAVNPETMLGKIKEAFETPVVSH